MNKPRLNPALLLGIAPLLAGAAVFIAFFLTRSTTFILAGFAVIAAGCICFAAGAYHLTRHNRWIRLQPPAHQPSLRRRSRLAWIILLLNFPAAATLVVAAAFVCQLYSVRVVNYTIQPLPAVTLTGGGVLANFGAIAPGSSKTRWFFIKHDGELILTTSRNSRKIDVTVEGYVTNGQGGRARADFDADGTVAVTDLPNKRQERWARLPTGWSALPRD